MFKKKQRQNKRLKKLEKVRKSKGRRFDWIVCPLTIRIYRDVSKGRSLFCRGYTSEIQHVFLANCRYNSKKIFFLKKIKKVLAFLKELLYNNSCLKERHKTNNLKMRD